LKFEDLVEFIQDFDLGSVKKSNEPPEHKKYNIAKSLYDFFFKCLFNNYVIYINIHLFLKKTNIMI